MDTRTWSIPTSPRSPTKLVGHVSLLKKFEGKKWNTDVQKQYAKELVDTEAFEGEGYLAEMAFSARDIINRAPKTLGFVRADSKTPILITPAGKKLIEDTKLNDLFLRQLLKWQYPSVKHDEHIYKERFLIKPFLETLRLIRELDGLSKMEIAMFAVPLIKYTEYNNTKEEIITYRKKLNKLKGVERKKFQLEYHLDRMRKIYAEELSSGDLHLREAGGATASMSDYLKTKRRNTIDYADAAIRYFRMTNLFVISSHVYKLGISEDKVKIVDDILRTIPREPAPFDDEEKFLSSFEDPELPQILTDDVAGLKTQIETILQILKKLNYAQVTDISHRFKSENSINGLKLILAEAENVAKQIKQKQQLDSLQDYSQYDDIQSVFDQLLGRDSDIPDKPLFFEWNIWRALSMLDDGDIVGNLEQDLEGKPVRLALGGFPDIVCYYRDFVLVVEVTLTSGRRQYEAEQEPVSRHVGDIIKELKEKGDNRKVYGLFLAPVINEASIAHFYTTRRIEVSYYGGKVKVIPLSVIEFRQMLGKARQAGGIKSKEIQKFIEDADVYADSSSNERDWFTHISNLSKNWITPR